MAARKSCKPSEESEEVPQKQWQWKSKMVEQLVKCLKDYKVEMDYKNVDFNADVVALYTRIREDMAGHFGDDEQLFGPVSLTESNKALTGMTKEELKRHNMMVSAEKSLIKKGYNRIKEKIRAIRKAYNKAITQGTRSGSGKVVQEYFDDLKLWKGSPATEKLEFGITSSDPVDTDSYRGQDNDPDNDTFASYHSNQQDDIYASLEVVSTKSVSSTDPHDIEDSGSMDDADDSEC